MRRRRRVKPSGGVQMFSFLDAMICTMGALLVLLHAFARHGQIQIAQKAEARASGSDLKADREDADWRIQHLKQSRAATEAELAEERLKLSHVEDHERRLRDQFRSLTIAAEEMKRLDTTTTDEHQRGRVELEETQDKVRRAQEALELARQAAQHSASAYSVVPYEGPHATRRRPIYIECRADSVVLQPEGIELAPEDFAGLPGPGNPLASALRGMREYLARQPASSSGSGEPYPLLLVRPEGIEAYYAARSALDSWGSEFGYELVGSDWKLKFPEPDPQLAALARRVVDEARHRQQEYIVSAPQIVRRGNRPTYHARSHGGFAPQGGSRGAHAGTGGSGWESLGSSWSRRGGNGGSSENDGGSQSGVAGGRIAAAGQSGSETGGAWQEAPGGGQLGEAKSGAAGQVDRYGNALADGGPRSGQSGSRDAREGTRFGASGSSDEHRGESGLASDGQRRAGSSSAPGSSANDLSGLAQSGTRGQSSSAPAGSATAASDSQGATNSLGATGSQGSESQAQPAGATPPAQMNSSSQAKKVKSIASTRGRDWGLPDAGLAAMAATRPIRVECHNDRLIIVPEGRNEVSKEIRLGESTQSSMDELVSNVWEHMKGWGVAGKGIYWRPTLLMDVKPGAADRYAEIKALLADSGLEVHERRPQTATQAPVKKTNRK